MLSSGKWLFAAGSAVMTLLASAPARAGSIDVLHMDINCVTISAFDSTGTTAVPFTGSTFTGELKFGTNSNTTLDVDVDGNPSVGWAGHITGYSGDIQLSGGFLAGGTVTVSVANGAMTNTYTYDIVANSGACYKSPSMPVFHMMGYELDGLTDDGIFANSNFGGVSVSNWVNSEPLLGDFFQFHYRPDPNTGVDAGGDVELYVDAATPLPAAVYGGLLGTGMLGVYQWRRSRKMKRMS